MRNFRESALLAMCRQGRCESASDILAGRVVQIRWTASGKVEMVQVVCDPHVARRNRAVPRRSV